MGFSKGGDKACAYALDAHGSGTELVAGIDLEGILRYASLIDEREPLCIERVHMGGWLSCGQAGGGL